MHLRTLAIILAALLGLAAAPAFAKSPHRYTLHGKHCKHGYRKARRPHKTFCIKRPTRKGAAFADKVKLHAHLDPSYTRNPLDPFEVTYAYSASATQEPLAGRASISTEEPASLPSGVLAFYSDGKLECAVNVGGSATGSECPVEYQALGEHRVTTIYSSGEQSATETEVESIQSLPTSPSLSASYVPRDTATAVGATGWWWIGTLTATPSVLPNAASIGMDCGEEAIEPFGRVTAGNCYILAADESQVYGWFNCDEETAALVRISAEPPTPTDPTVTWPSGSQIASGALHIQAKSGGAGYLPATMSAQLQFAPVKPTTC